MFKSAFLTTFVAEMKRTGLKLLYVAALAVTTVGVCACGGKSGNADPNPEVTLETVSEEVGFIRDEKGPMSHGEVMMVLMPDDTVRSHNPYEEHFDSMPPGGRKLRINGLGGYLGRVFNDSNKLHIAVAEAHGIRPLHTLEDVWSQAVKLERLQTCEAYYLDNLTHSLPYLTPRAHRLLTDIGLAFRDSLDARGGGYYRIKVTSVLRTPALVKKLRRRNRNAVDTSAHLFGATFDISYLKFICDSTNIPRTQEDLKNLLAEVVEAQRKKGRCYVKYERKQSCFHITAR